MLASPVPWPRANASLCGRASYRDLLGTAESIIEMDRQGHEVEDYLGDIGAKCNTRILERKQSSLRRWNMAVGAVGIIHEMQLGQRTLMLTVMR